MDWLVFCDFIKSVQDQTDVPIDVYDLAAWMSISALAEQSIALGGQPVAIPDSPTACGSRENKEA